MNKNIQSSLVFEAVGNLQKLAESFQARREQLALRVGLTEQQWRVLEEISTEHFMPSMFATRQESSKAAVSNVLRQLLDKNLIAVSVSAEDGRMRQYGLSVEGKATMERLRKERERAMQTVWMPLDEGLLKQFNQLSTELIKRLEAYYEEQRGTKHG